MNLKRDTIVGLFVLVAIVILAIVTMMLRHWDFFNRRYTYYVKFDHVRQLDVGSPVLAYGIVVGSVSQLKYIGPPHPILVTMRIDKEVQLWTNAQLRVIPAQVIGSTTLNIDSNGYPSKDSLLIKPDDPEEVIEGAEPQPMENIMTDALTGISKILNDKDTQTAFKGTMVNLASVTERMDTTFRMINEQFVPLVRELKQSSANLNQMLTNATTATQHIADSIAGAGQSIQTAGNEYARTGRTLDVEIKTMADRLDKVIAQMQQTVQTTQQPIADALKDIKETSRSLREVVDRINRGDGTLGRLINDPRPIEKLDQLIDSLSQRLTGSSAGGSLFPQVQTTPRAVKPEPPKH